MPAQSEPTARASGVVAHENVASPRVPEARGQSRTGLAVVQVKTSAVGQYSVALLAFGIALFLERVLGVFMATHPFLFFYGAVAIAGWWGGWGPALMNTALSLISFSAFFPLGHQGDWVRPSDVVSLGIFAMLSLLVTKLNVSLRQTNAERALLLERERAARSEAENERARLHALFMQAPAHIALFRGPQHIYELSNPPNNELLGHRQLVGRTVRQAVPTAEAEVIASLLDRVYTSGEPFVGREMPIRVPRSDGGEHEVYFNLVYQPTRNSQGQVDGIAGFGFDVTDLAQARQRAEALTAELRHGEERLRMLAEAGATLASSLDYEATLKNMARLAVPRLADWCFVDVAMADGTFKRVEVAHAAPEDAPLAERARGFTAVLAGNPLHPPTQALLRGEALIIEDFTDARLEASGHSVEHVSIMRAIRPRSFVIVPLVVRERTMGVLTCFTTHSGRHYTNIDLSFFRELASRASLSMENARLYREAQEAIHLRDEFLSIASHELKTPLTPLSLKLQSLSRELSRTAGMLPRPLVESYVEVGSRQVKKLSELVNTLLDVSRIASGRLRLDAVEVDLAALVRELVGRHEAQAVRMGSPLQLEGADVPIIGWWDRLRLEQVVMNLVDNAIKYGQGRPIHLRLAEGPERARLTVRDEGIGIAPEHLPRIFGRFERAVSDRHYGGLGLGLYITRTLVEAMSGTVRVESLLGRGSTFTVELPRAHHARDS
ncbi:histidine kinase [Corallococcus sp. H22C18031201]|nr:GAF domain-containing protein [Citreicoccus inhibens]RJS20094.1 histidine kinase [Corallococcus sp. H22C18031201]